MASNSRGISAAIDPTGNMAAYSDFDSVHLRSLHDLNAPFDAIGMAMGNATYQTVLFSYDGQTLVSATRDIGLDQSTIHIWHLGTPGSQIAILSIDTRLEGSNNFITALALTPDDRILVSGGYYRTIRLWDLGDREALPMAIEGQTEIRAMAISSRGEILAAGGADGAIRLWSMADPAAPAATLLGHQEPVRFLAFSPTAPTLASGGDDGTVRFWPTLDGLREIGCSLVQRNLSLQEWRAYLGENEPYRPTCPELEPPPAADG